MSLEDILIKRAAAGDKEAFEQLVDKYKGYVFAIILNLIRDSFYAEDIAQEVFQQVYLSLPRYRFGGFKSWLGRIATRKAIDWKRKQQSIQEKEKAAALLEKLAVQGEYGNIEESMIRREDVKRIKVLCRQLPESCQRVIKKYYFSGKSYQQIASEEGIAVKTVETRLYRARQKLKERWKEDE